MKHMAISLETMSPLAIRADHAPGGMATAPYIPGSTFLGSLAAAHRMIRSDQAREEFEQLFLSGQIHYPNLYPAAFKDQKIEDARSAPVYPVPLTAQTCKRHPGFIPVNPEDEDDEHHGVRDTLFDWAIYKTMVNNEPGSLSSKVLRQRLQVLQRHKECQTCKATMDHFGGYYRRTGVERYPFHSAVIDSHKRLRTHTGINRGLGSVQEGILYNRQVFEEDMRFWGEVRLPDDEQAFVAFTDFINEVGTKGWVRIGTGRSRGMGKVTLRAEAIEQDRESLETFKKRMQEFNQSLRSYVERQTQNLGVEGLTIKPFYVALTLHSPVILCDDRLRYFGTIDVETLAKQAKVIALPFTPLYQAASVRRIMGWNELWGMPRGHEFAIDTGSVFLYECEVEPDETIYRALYNLEDEGIGRRRAEGFGRVRFSDPFHLEVNLR